MISCRARCHASCGQARLRQTAATQRDPVAGLSPARPACAQVQLADPPVVQAVLTDLPGLLFFSTYTLLVLFWAEIYHQARSLPTSKLRPIFVTANAVVYLIQVLDYWFASAMQVVRLLCHLRPTLKAWQRKA
jgi:Protein of unknown function (DUF1084)